MPTTGFNAVVDQYMSRHRTLREAFEGPNSKGVGYTMSLQVGLSDQPAISKPIDTPAAPGNKP
jgi:hypothetical protein